MARWLAQHLYLILIIIANFIIKLGEIVSSEQQKQELFKAIWSAADKARNQIDSWDFKGYILGFLFYRYISEDFCAFVNKKQKESTGGGI